MVRARFTSTSLLIRIFLSMLLVFSTYNPTHYSYYHWLLESPATDMLPYKVAVFIILLAGWIAFGYATYQALKLIGLVLVVALLGVIFWILITQGLLEASPNVIQYAVLIIISLVMGIGLSWAYVWRWLTGQLTTDAVEY